MKLEKLKLKLIPSLTFLWPVEISQLTTLFDVFWSVPAKVFLTVTFLDLSCHIRETETRTLKSVKSQCFGFIVMHLSAAIPEGDPGEPPVICTTTFTNPPSRGQRSVLFQVKKCNISKEFYTRTRKFSSEKYSSYVSNRWPAERNRIQEQEKYESRLPSFLSPFCQNVFTNIPSPFEGGNGTRYQFHLQNGGGATLPRVFPRRSCYESAMVSRDVVKMDGRVFKCSA